MGIYPYYLQRATITPILKSGDRNCIHNYRPISVLPFMRKLVEKSLSIRLVNFLGKLSIIPLHHYGFTKGKSTHDALIGFSDHIFAAIDKKQSPISVFVDHSKAFDTVDHAILLAKTERNRFRGLPLNMFPCFFFKELNKLKFVNVILMLSM